MTDTHKGAFDGVFDKVVGEYDTEGVTFFKPVAERLVEHIGVQPGDRVLDIGAGRGAVTFPLARAVGQTGSVVGIDLAQGMVDALRADAAGVPNITVLRMNGQNPEFPAGSFDVIAGSMSIPMIPDLGTAFGNFVKLLTPGGKIAFTAPDTRNQVGAWRAGPVDIGRLAAEIPDEVKSGHPMLSKLVEGNLLDLTGIVRQLEEAGFAGVIEHREKVTVVAETPGNLVRWTQQHGMRAVWDAVPAHRRAAVEAEMTAEATQWGDADGKLRFGFPVVYFVARTR